MVHEALLGLVPDGVELLGGGERVQRGDGEHLRLAAGEESGAVDNGQHADFRAERTDLVHGAAVHTLAGEQPLLDDLLLQLVEDLVHVLHDLGMVGLILFLHRGDPLVHAGFADVLVVGVHAVLHAGKLVLDKLFKKLIVERGVLVGELGLADLGDHAVDKIEHRLHHLVRLHDALVHDIVGDLVGLGLDHNDLLVRGGDGRCHAVGFLLGGGGVEEELLTVPAEDDTGDGAVERDIGNGNGGGSADHRGDLGGAVTVNGEHFAGDDNVVAQVGREERAHRAVDETAREHGVERGTALAAVEAAGNAADGVELLIEVYGEREVVDAVLRAGRRGGGHENAGVAVADENRSVAELGHLADLHEERTAAVVHFVTLEIRKFLVRDDHSFVTPFIYSHTLVHKLKSLANVRSKSVHCGEPQSFSNESLRLSFERKYGGTVFTCPSVKNLHNPRQVSANYLRIPSFAIMAR